MNAEFSVFGSQSPVPRRAAEAPIRSIRVSAYRIPTDFPESDGTLEWDSTTLVLVEAEAGGERGLGYSYADTATALLARDLLAPRIAGSEAERYQI